MKSVGVLTVAAYLSGESFQYFSIGALACQGVPRHCSSVQIKYMDHYSFTLTCDLRNSYK